MKIAKTELVNAVNEKDPHYMPMICAECNEPFRIVCPSTGGKFSCACPKCKAITSFHVNLIEK